MSNELLAAHSYDDRRICGLGKRVRDAFVKMTARLDGGIPQAIGRNALYNLRRGLSSRPFGWYPDMASACLRKGAPLTDVLAPLRAMEDQILADAKRLGKLPGVAEAIWQEQNANVEADRAEREFLRFPSKSNRETMIDAWHDQEIITRVARVVVQHDEVLAA